MGRGVRVLYAWGCVRRERGVGESGTNGVENGAGLPARRPNKI
jgi:hypothetical protein